MMNRLSKEELLRICIDYLNQNLCGLQELILCDMQQKNGFKKIAKDLHCGYFKKNEEIVFDRIFIIKEAVKRDKKLFHNILTRIEALWNVWKEDIDMQFYNTASFVRNSLIEMEIEIENSKILYKIVDDLYKKSLRKDELKGFVLLGDIFSKYPIGRYGIKAIQDYGFFFAEELIYDFLKHNSSEYIILEHGLNYKTKYGYYYLHQIDLTQDILYLYHKNLHKEMIVEIKNVIRSDIPINSREKGKLSLISDFIYPSCR